MDVAERSVGYVPAVSPADQSVSGAVTVRGAVTFLALLLAAFPLRYTEGSRLLSPWLPRRLHSQSVAL